MIKAILHIFMAGAAILFCWLPLLIAIKDFLGSGPMHAPLKTCVTREWARWWDIYDEERNA